MNKSQDFVLFIGGLSPQVTNQDLLTYFNNYGEIARAKIIVDKKTNIPKGYAYVTCQDVDTYNQILNCSHEIMGRDVDVQVAHSGTKIVSDIQNQMLKKLCIKNLSLETTQADQNDYFSNYGNVKHAYIIINHQTKKSKQFGYIEFFGDDDCEMALKNGPHTVNGKIIECEKFIPKAIEKKNKKNVDSRVIQEKLKDLKEKEDEAKEKRITSPNKSQKKQGITISKWDDENNNEYPKQVTPRKNTNLLGVDYHYATPNSGNSSVNRRSKSGFTISGVSSYDGYDSKQAQVYKDKDKSFNEIISIDNEKIDAYKEAIIDDYQITPNKSRGNPRSGNLDNVNDFDNSKKKIGKVFRANSHSNIVTPKKDTLVTSDRHIDDYSKRNNAGLRDNVSNTSSGYFIAGGKKIPLKYTYITEHGKPLPLPPKHHYTPSCYCPACWRYTLKYQSPTSAEKKDKLMHQINEQGVHDPDHCYACSIAHYANQSKMEYTKSVTNSPPTNKKKIQFNLKDIDDQWNLNQIYNDKKLFKSPQVNRKGPPGLTPIEKNMLSFGVDNMKLFSMNEGNLESPRIDNQDMNNTKFNTAFNQQNYPCVNQVCNNAYMMRGNENYTQNFINNQQLSPPKNPNAITYMNINNHTSINNQNEPQYVYIQPRSKSPQPNLYNNANPDFAVQQNMRNENNQYFPPTGINQGYQQYYDNYLRGNNSPNKNLNPGVKAFVPGLPNKIFDFHDDEELFDPNFDLRKKTEMRNSLVEKMLFNSDPRQQANERVNDLFLQRMKNNLDKDTLEYYKHLRNLQIDMHNDNPQKIQVNNNQYYQNFKADFVTDLDRQI